MDTIARKIRSEIFQRYIGQGVIFDNIIKGVLMGYRPNLLMPLIVIEDIDNNTPIFRNWNILDTSIVVTPLEQLTDEDALEIYKLLGDPLSDNYDDVKIFHAKELIHQHSSNIKTNVDGFHWLTIFQYLQSKGYALPYLNYSVDDLIRIKVYKYKQTK